MLLSVTRDFKQTTAKEATKVVAILATMPMAVGTPRHLLKTAATMQLLSGMANFASGVSNATCSLFITKMDMLLGQHANKLMKARILLLLLLLEATTTSTKEKPATVAASPITSSQNVANSPLTKLLGTSTRTKLLLVVGNHMHHLLLQAQISCSCLVCSL